MNVKQVGDEIIATVKSHVAAALQPLASRLSAVEVRAGALGMMYARSDRDRETLARLEAHVAQVHELQQRVRALEDKASGAK